MCKYPPSIAPENIFPCLKVGKRLVLSICAIISLTFAANSQIVQDDFEGNGTINTWSGDDCGLDTDFLNPYQQGINPSAKVLKYNDEGGQFANVRFDVDNNLDLSVNHVFSFKIYVPSNGLTGSQPNQVSLKLQDGSLAAPWSTQSEIIKPLALDQWLTVSFDFKNDNYINLSPGSPPPTQRTDFNRVLIQINGENNSDQVLAYVDDFFYDGTVPVPPVFDQLVWSDEFDGEGALDTSKWFHQTQLPLPDSWFNSEIQHYTDREDNAKVENGALSIIAKKETFTDQGHTKQFTSARLNSKFAFKYGRVEIRAKLPSGVGTWPAIWTLGKNIDENGAYWDNQGFGTTGWPACGEIDIMEHWGHNQNQVQSATHTPSSSGATVNLGGQNIPTASSAFHVYALEWTPEKLVFSVDSVAHYTYAPAEKNADTWPFDAEQYLLLNVAILPNIEPGYTASAMEVDYVRVYQQSTTVATVEVNAIKRLSHFPNPVEDELKIILPETPVQDITFNIYHLDGRLIKTIQKAAVNDTVSLDGLGKLKSGAYILNFQANGNQYSLKIFKK